MRILDISLPEPAANLACDEALLEMLEMQGGEEILRFWEPPTTFVVVGYSNRVDTEVDVATCRQNDVPVLRRCSGGGTVVQAAGCLNYSLILRIADRPELGTLTATNHHVMERHRQVIQDVLGGEQGCITFDGHTDLALNDRKFSGNAQRRKREHILFHGSFLLSVDLELISTFLPLPSLQPSYRRGRSHRDFLTNLPLSVSNLKTTLAGAWEAKPSEFIWPRELTTQLVATKYRCHDWNYRR